MAKKNAAARARARRDVEAAEVRRAIACLEQPVPNVAGALEALRGAAIGLEAADALAPTAPEPEPDWDDNPDSDT